jgi:hypothetical protein
MPPRYAYWTIIAGGLPTAFRAAERSELEPTFQRLREKHPDAEMKWFARGKLWDSPEAARPKRDDARWRDDERGGHESRGGHGDRSGHGDRGGPGGRGGHGDRGKPNDRWRREDHRPRADAARPPRQDAARPPRHDAARPPRQDASRPPRQDASRAFTARDDDKRGRDWRPGGQHRDPRQKFKDAKQARNQRWREEKFDRKKNFSDRTRDPRDRKPFEDRRGPAGPPKPDWRAKPPRQKPQGDPLRNDVTAPRPRSQQKPEWRDRPPRKEWKDRPPTGKRFGSEREGGPAPQKRWDAKREGGPARPPREKPQGDPLRNDIAGPRARSQQKPAWTDRPPRKEWKDRPSGAPPAGPKRWTAEREGGPAAPPVPPKRSQFQREGGRDRAPKPPRDERGESKRPFVPRGDRAFSSGPRDERKGFNEWTPKEKPHGDKLGPNVARGFKPREGFERNQGTEEPQPPPRPRGPNREPRPDESPEPGPPPRPSEPVIPPPGPQERGRLNKNRRRER